MPWITELKVEKVKEDGTPYTITTEPFPKALAKLLRDKESNFPGADGRVVPTFAEAAEKWFETRETNCKASTIESYRYLLDTHVLPIFGPMRLDEITRENVEAFVSGKKKAGLAPRSIRPMLATMRPVFKRAIKDGGLTSNAASEPAELIKLGGKKKVAVFTGE